MIEYRYPKDIDPEGWARACAEADEILRPFDESIKSLTERINRIRRNLFKAELKIPIISDSHEDS